MLAFTSALKKSTEAQEIQAKRDEENEIVVQDVEVVA